MAAKFQQLQELFPDANVVSMVESDATVLLYDYTSVSVKVIMRARPKRRHRCCRLPAFGCTSLCGLPLVLVSGVG